ncbi:MAG: ArsR/SmtB family transcription factor [Gemmatimonadota bacterium]
MTRSSDVTPGSRGSPYCEVELVHRDAVLRALADRADDVEIEELADIFQLLANPTRLRILEALAREELCVCDLAAVVEASQSAVSHHLRHLRAMRLVRYRKEGRMAFYHLDDDHVTTLIRTALNHVRE